MHMQVGAVGKEGARGTRKSIFKVKKQDQAGAVGKEATSGARKSKIIAKKLDKSRKWATKHINRL